MNTTTANPEADPKSAADSPTYHRTAPRPLYRPFEDRMLAGVAAGIARYLGVEANVVRIALAVLAVIGGVGVPLYLAGWLLIPEEGREQSIASEFIESLQSRSR